MNSGPVVCLVPEESWTDRFKRLFSCFSGSLIYEFIMDAYEHIYEEHISNFNSSLKSKFHYPCPTVLILYTLQYPDYVNFDYTRFRDRLGLSVYKRFPFPIGYMLTNYIWDGHSMKRERIQLYTVKVGLSHYGMGDISNNISNYKCHTAFPVVGCI